MSKKTLMVLGAGTFQLPGIKRAKELGYRVVTVDYLPGNIGHLYSDEKIICSTVDHEGILKAARKAHIDGIITFCSDVAAFSVAYTAEKLGLRGVNLNATTIMTRKDTFRKFQKDVGLNTPDFAAAESFQALDEFLRTKDRTLVFKPVDSSGSRGISIIHSKSSDQRRKAFDHALAFSRAGIVCVEEFINGTEVGGDGFILAGKLRYKGITHKYKNGVIVTGHSLPDILSESERQSVYEEIERTCEKVGYHEGPLNFDVMVHPEGPTILEIGPRNGGNGISEIMSYGKGFNVLDIGIRFAMGEPTGAPPSESGCRGCGSFVFGSPRAGSLTNIANREEIMADIKEVLDCTLIKKKGDKLEKFEHGGALIGYAVFQCPEPSDYENLTKRIEQALRLEVTGGQEP